MQRVNRKGQVVRGPASVEPPIGLGGVGGQAAGEPRGEPFGQAVERVLIQRGQPDLTTKGKLAFELPPNKVSGSTLVIEDIFGDGKIKVDLGL